MNIDFSEILARALKYLIEGRAVGLACYFTNLKFDTIIIIAITAAATFAVLDMFSPQVSDAARLGTGFGIGSQFAGLRTVARAGF